MHSLDALGRVLLTLSVVLTLVLAFARRQPLNPKPTDVNRLITEALDLVRRTLGASISVETVHGAGLWKVEVDHHQLESALLNLAVNSRDAMPSGGKLTIETAHTCPTYWIRWALRRWQRPRLEKEWSPPNE